MNDASALRAFIEARLAEDERLALAFLSERRVWEATGGYAETGPTQVRSGDILIIEDDSSWASEAVCHIARHDPARVLREVAAKRAILQRYEIAGIGAEATAGTVLAGASRLRMATLDDVLLALASVWSGHPDYRPEWSDGTVVPAT